MVRSGGAYIPPARLAAMLPQQHPDPSDPAYRASDAFQRLSWDALKKSLNGIVNKVNTANLKYVVAEAFGENLVRGRGLLVKAVMRAQMAALPFTAVYAAFMAIINTKLPMIGELLLIRLVIQFRRAYKRNDKTQCLAVTMFLGHLVNHRVGHEIVVLQLLMLLLENPTEDSVEIACGLMREVGHFLIGVCPRPCDAVFERFRAILMEANLDKRIQYMIEVLFQVRKDGFKEYLAVRPELDLVDEEDQITHHVSLDDEELNGMEELNVYSFDEKFLDNEQEYLVMRNDILGINDGPELEQPVVQPVPNEQTVAIKDETGMSLVNLRKTIYLTLMSSIDVDEAGHKLLKLSIPEGSEIELANMIVECCSQERTYLKYYGLLAERFCRLNLLWEECFVKCFHTVYSSVHKIDTSRIRNITKLFGHLLETDSLPWTVFSVVRLTEDDTTASSRIFLKFLFQELSEYYSQPTLANRLEDLSLQEAMEGVWPRDSLRNIRFSIHFFEAIELPLLAESQRRFIAELEAELAAEERAERGRVE